MRPSRCRHVVSGTAPPESPIQRSFTTDRVGAAVRVLIAERDRLFSSVQPFMAVPDSSPGSGYCRSLVDLNHTAHPRLAVLISTFSLSALISP